MARPPEFSTLELQIVTLICKQWSSEEIAIKLKKSKRTIEGYRRIIIKKMRVKNTAGIVVFSIKKGLFKI